MKLIAPLLALTLSACATQGSPALSIYDSLSERRQAPPIMSYESAKAPDKVRDCMLERLGDFTQLGVSAGDAAILPFGDGWTVKSSGIPVKWFADVTPTPSGSQVKVYVAGGFAEGLRTRLAAC